MRTSRILLVLVAAGLLTAQSAPSLAQDVQNVRSHLPKVTSDSTGTSAVLYSYFPSIDLTVKMEARSRPHVFTATDVAYMLGGLFASLPSMLAQWWYPHATPAQLANIAARLQKESKDLQTPFEEPRATLLVDLGSDGLTFTYTGRTPKTSSSVTYTRKVSWKEVLGESGS